INTEHSNIVLIFCFLAVRVKQDWCQIRKTHSGSLIQLSMNQRIPMKNAGLENIFPHRKSSMQVILLKNKPDQYVGVPCYYII
ncbi:MAG TPA: hypothetical protein VFH07_02045, partial [Chitinophagaceae bacterium]|nr:hypothetical protein [Chitinophagaceae bacterium]